MSHAPGPWEISTDRNVLDIIADVPYAPLAKVHGVGPTSWANARLIVAAPDLLEALVGIASCLDCYRSGVCSKHDGPAAAALAKARGES